MTTTKPLSKTAEARYYRLTTTVNLKGERVAGCPRYVRCYDNGGPDKRGSIDRYTVTFPRVRIGTKEWGSYPFLSMNAYPFAPQGYGLHGEAQRVIDRPTYGYLGKRIAFHDLPEDCQRLVLQDYAEYWSLPLDRLLTDCLRPSK